MDTTANPPIRSSSPVEAPLVVVLTEATPPTRLWTIENYRTSHSTGVDEQNVAVTTAHSTGVNEQNVAVTTSHSTGVNGQNMANTISYSTGVNNVECT